MDNLIPVEYSNQIIISTQQIAEAYKTDAKVISKNFNNNKKRYQEGKHYYCLEGEQLKSFLHSSNLRMQNQNCIRKLYLWTERGALLHAKSLNTDKAWQVYETLVDSYFNKESQPTISQEQKNTNTTLKVVETLLRIASMDYVTEDNKLKIVSNCVEILTGKPLIPVKRKLYSAFEFGSKFNLRDGGTIKRLTKECGIRTPEYGEWVEGEFYFYDTALEWYIEHFNLVKRDKVNY